MNAPSEIVMCGTILVFALILYLCRRRTDRNVAPIVEDIEDREAYAGLFRRLNCIVYATCQDDPLKVQGYLVDHAMYRYLSWKQQRDRAIEWRP